jgi:probable rRNA maturation factor
MTDLMNNDKHCVRFGNKMTIEVTNTSGQLVPTAEMVSLMTHALNALELNPECDLNISFVEDDYMTELHIKWMDEPGTTDVLSFPMDMPEEPGEVVTLGDIVISPVVAAAQALTQGHSTEHEIYILATHGLLHIIGYDHADKADEKIMFELQEKIVTDWEKRS